MFGATFVKTVKQQLSGRAFQEYFLAYYTPGKDMFFFARAFDARDAFSTIHEPVRLPMCSFWVFYDLSSGILGMILMYFIMKKHISSLEPSALARHSMARYMQLHAG